MGSALRILPHYTYNDYLEWEGRWEIIEGVPHAMSPAPAPRHQWLAANIKSELLVAIKKVKCGDCKVYDFLDYKVQDDTVIQPDALIVCGEISKNFLDFPPALVVEILSPSTMLKDRNNKYVIYETQKVAYYLIVDPDSNSIELFKLGTDQKYVPEPFDPALPYHFNLGNGCGIDVTLANIWQ